MQSIHHVTIQFTWYLNTYITNHKWTTGSSISLRKDDTFHTLNFTPSPTEQILEIKKIRCLNTSIISQEKMKCVLLALLLHHQV
jgi:hypothetical protein